MVNSGAIAATSLVPGAQDKWGDIHRGLSGFAGHELSLNADVYDSALRTNQQNRSIAALLDRRGRIYCDPAQAIDLYTRQCSLNVSATDLAVMGATLADGGVNPLTRERGIDEEICRHTLAVMTTAGLYQLGRFGCTTWACQAERDRNRLARQGRARHVRPTA